MQQNGIPLLFGEAGAHRAKIDQNSAGCSVTPCIALSQASCQSPDDTRGAALSPEEVGVNVGVTISKKSPATAAVVITARKCQEVTMLGHAVLASESFIFYIKKLPNGIKDLKTIKSEDPKPKKQTVATENMVLLLLRGIAESVRLTSGAYQAMLCQNMWS